MTCRLLAACLAFVLLGVPAQAFAQEREYDLVIYGGSSAGVAAAIQASRMGKTAIIIEPSQHLGGLTSGGLGWTDSGNKAVIGGISREFYQRVKAHYDKPESWNFDSRETYRFYRKDDDAMWTFEPKVAEMIFRQMCEEAKIPVVYGERLNRTPINPENTRRIIGVAMNGQRITAITMESGKTYKGKIFIDATYEGDLLAGAGVSYTVGREGNDKYGEKINGVQRALNVKLHRFIVKVDPYIKPGDPKSGLLHGMDPGPYPEDGEGDHRVQAYCYRMCMSLDPNNRIPFPKPDNYDESKYELLFRNFEAGDMRLPLKPDMMPNGKTDTNNNCAVSTDYIGQNYGYPDGSYAEREKILANHLNYQKGLMWTLQNHPRVPQKIRDQMARWGLPKDEFTDNGNWTHQIYVREARRMVSDYVMTELDCRRQKATPASVGMGSYNMDSHNCMRWVTKDGFVQNEGDVQVSPGGAYQISYGSLVPKKGEATNLLVPVCVSSSHASYGSIRMEPVFMILGQSAATAACMAIDEKIDVQAVEYDKLQERLLADRQVLDYAGGRPSPAHVTIDPKKLPGIVIDDVDARLTSQWPESTSVTGYVGKWYLHDNNDSKGQRSITFTATIDKAGEYDVRVSYTANPNRASNVPVTVEQDGKTVLSAKVNQKQEPKIDGTWVSIGKVKLAAGTVSVTISNKDTDGHVIADAVQLLP